MNTGDIFIGVSLDSKIREQCENGGVVTALLQYVLEKKIVDYVFAVKEGKNRYEAILSCIIDPEKVIGCSGSLHFATPPIAKYIKKYVNTDKERIAVVCKSCDARALVELSKLNQVNIKNIVMIGVNCSGTLSPVPHINMLREKGMDPYQLIHEDIDEKNLIFQFDNGTEMKFNLEELEKIGLGRRGNCQRCEYPVPRMADIACGRWGMEKSEDSGTFVEICSEKGRELFEQAVLSSAVKVSSPTQEQIEMRDQQETQKIKSALEVQKREFSELTDKFYWVSQFENCIKCYSCRDICPLCHCKRCVLERDTPVTVTKGVVPPPFTFGATRVLHVACQCINCGQCDDVCSADISLSRLVHNLNKESSKLFNYEAGIDRESPHPLCNIPEDEKKLETSDLPYR